ncbi:MAG: DUF3126 family protein [Alphaproteobacteria bacterium]
MTPNEVARVQAYLRQTFGNDNIHVAMPERPDAPCEMSIEGEFLAIIFRDEDDGEVSYALNMSILEEDLAPDQ